LTSEIFGTAQFYPHLVIQFSKHQNPFPTLETRPKSTGTKLIQNQSLPKQKLF